MILKTLGMGLSLMLCACTARADTVQSIVDKAMTNLTLKVSGTPYSRTIEKMMIGYDAQGEPKVGIAYRKIEAFKPITAVVIIEKTAKGFVLREALFPDIEKIKNTKDRNQVLAVLRQFKGVPFDPHAEKSAVNGLSGATRHGIKTSGYLNHLARKIALEMEAKPDWATKK